MSRGGYNKNKTADAPNCHPVEDLPAASAVDFDTIEELPSECASVDDTGQQHPAHAHVAEQLLLALPAVWNNLQHNSPAGAHLTPKTFRGLLAQEAGVDLSAADECKEAVDSLISVLSDVDFPDSGQEKAVEQQRADDKIPYWIVNQKIKMRCEYTGATLSLPHLFGRSAKTVDGLHTEIERARQVATFLVEHDTGHQFPTLSAPGVKMRQAARRLLKLLRESDDDIELNTPIQSLLVWAAENGMNEIIGVLTCTHLSSNAYCLDNCALAGDLAWPSLYAAMLLQKYERKKEAAAASGGAKQGPRPLAPRIALRGHLYQTPELTSLIASAEHSHGGPHHIGARLLLTRDHMDIAKIFRDAMSAAKKEADDREREVPAGEPVTSV